VNVDLLSSTTMKAGSSVVSAERRRPEEQS
jgi:hypothetical protein